MSELSLLLSLSTVLGVLVSLGLMRGLSAERAPRLPRRPDPDQEDAVFLFDGHSLVDATGAGLALIADRPERRTEWNAALSVLERHFPDLRRAVREIEKDGTARQVSDATHGLTLDLSKTEGLTRFHLLHDRPAGRDRVAETAQAVLGEEVALLRKITDNAPQLIWQEDGEGRLLWANATYLDLADRLMKSSDKGRTVWPGGRVFGDLVLPDKTALEPIQNRYSVSLPDKAGPVWYDVTSMPLSGGIVHYAVDANTIVNAEIARRDFFQLLSKTFAQLSIGLAIFDRQRKLTMFNPALLDLTGLPFDFLSGRPLLGMILDRMRESNRLPEPQNYHAWRKRMTTLEAEAENGIYHETWELADGQTIRVTGRPHPDGGLAFFLEDISNEVLLTRRFRADIETGQAVLDTLPDAIAVFSEANTLVMSNTAYQALWGGSDPDHLMPGDLRSAIRVWQAGTVPTRFWNEITALATGSAGRTALQERLTLSDGRHALCSATPINGGMTMVKFTVGVATAPLIRKVDLGQPVPLVAKA